MKKSMDLFGKALLSYLHGDRDKFFFGNSSGDKYAHPLKKYFRSYDKLTRLERKIISLANGEILDVGCGTGMYVPYLAKKGKVTGIDISTNIIRVAKEMKIKNVFVADIFKFKPKKKYDTIVLLENNLGMAETLKRTKQLLKILGSLLKENGKILTNIRNVPRGTYFVGELYPIWKGQKGQKFKWISFNAKFLRKLCDEEGLKLKIVDRDKWNYLAILSKN